MKALTAALTGAAALAVASPAEAQYYDYRYDRDRDVVEEVVDGVARVAVAVRAATQGGYYDRYDRGRFGYGRGAERYAADTCAREAQRRYARRYGRIGVDIRDVFWHRNNRLRVLGSVDLRGYGYDRYRRYDRSDRYDRYSGRRIAFTCTVRPDGRVTGFRTHNYDW